MTNNSFRSKEDDVMKISTTMYVTNFPEETNAKELFRACSVYGHVVDSFIPNKRAKNGKRFGFVRFINVFSEERLANNLRTVWMGNHKLFANISKFQRNNNKGEYKAGSENNNYPIRKPAFASKHQSSGVNKDSYSYAKVVSGTDAKKEKPDVELSSLVLDDDCLVSSEFPNSLFGRLKEFVALVNIKNALVNEGFIDINIKYLGEFWIMVKFPSLAVKQSFREIGSVGSWFSILKEASSEFYCEKRIAWVETEGIPFKLWTENTFKRIASRWGVLISVDDQDDSCYHSKRLCVHTSNPRSISEDFKIIFHGKVHWIRAKETPGWVPDFEDANENEESDEDMSNDGDKNQKSKFVGSDEVEEGQEYQAHGEPSEEGEVKLNEETSEDPFNIYPILNDMNKNKEEKRSSSSYTHPPGFSFMEGQEDVGSCILHFMVDDLVVPQLNYLQRESSQEGVVI